MKSTLGNSERLKRKIDIDMLFSEGKSITQFPIKLVYKLEVDQNTSSQLLVSVPKRNFKKAVDRNLLKRRLREAYRINKKEVSLPKGRLLVGIIYLARDIRDFNEVQDRLILSLRKLNEALAQ